MNFFEKRQLVETIQTAASNGVTLALRALKPAAAAPVTEKRVPFFTHPVSAARNPPPAIKKQGAPAREPIKPAGPVRREEPAMNTTLKTNRFAHLVAFGQPAAAPTAPAPRRLAAPTAAEYGAAAATVASARGPLAPHATRPAEADLSAARKVMDRGQVARNAEASDKRAAASAMADRILDAGDGRLVRS